MNKKPFTILSVLLIVILTTSPVSASPGIKLTSAFKLGSLIASEVASRLQNTDYTFVLDASGTASVVCTNPGGNDVPGQSSPHVDAQASKNVLKDIIKNGKATFDLVATPDIESNPILSPEVAGCPSDNWTARADFVYWTNATITIYYITDVTFSNPVATYQFSCVTTRTGPNGTPSTFDDGTVSCTQVN